MARTITRYNGAVSTATTIYTVPANKIAKVFFKCNSNYASSDGAANGGEHVRLTLNGNNIAGAICTGSSGVDKSSLPYDGTLYYETIEGSSTTDTESFVVNQNIPLILAATEVLAIEEDSYSGNFNYDFTVIEEGI